ncbi:hypothetical protein QBC47DRAFT_367824 [Echria macrotheca]|uniref:Ribosomal protein bL31m N-terminal domain-containing protein n=1 Tax=Echria macrotheca TaxID=438768 RepID=A0AAJ0BME7_9PEZI|nr:hypothetical protein QBC47DRAFT_367824 [Echria macrotheca]
MGKLTLPSTVLRRPTVLQSTLPQPPSLLQSTTTLLQKRNATFVPRPRRPYRFTQLVQLSDGSTFTVRTTMPTALYKSAKDTRNHVLWQPLDKTLRNVEVDEAGKLAAFRGRFGRGWDIDDAASPAASSPEAAGAGAAAGVPEVSGTGAAEEVKTAVEVKKAEETQKVEAKEEKTETTDPFDSLVDLISAYAKDEPGLKGGKTAKESGKGGKKKK